MTPTQRTAPLVDSKEVGLAIGLIVGENLMGMRDLHYGLWTDGLEVNLRNFSVAQERYSQFLLDLIPPGTRRILDVGSGAGAFTARLQALGYDVESVSPSPYLASRVKESLSGSIRIHPYRFEDLALSAETKYDLVLFSESFQYVNQKQALEKAASLLPPGKHLLISDFFKKPVPGTSPLGGGHPIEEFTSLLASSPFETVKEFDLTAETAPTMEMFGQVLDRVGIPVRDLVCGFISHRHPWIAKFLAWRLRHRFHKINDKYFSGKLNGESFSAFKSYKTYLLQRTASA